MTKGQTTRNYRRLRRIFLTQCEQANSPCWLCGQPIDYRIPWQDPHTGHVNNDAFELDHAYPRSLYPELAEDPGGFRPSHRACNRQRSNQMSIAGLGAPTRKWTR